MPTIEELIAQLLSQQQETNPLVGAIGKMANRGGQAMPTAMGVGGTQRPDPLPPSPTPDMNQRPPLPVQNVPGSDRVDPISTEDELATVQKQMGGAQFEPSGDMNADSAALVELYSSGDPNDPAVREQWESARQQFIEQYGEENLPDLPNDAAMPSDSEEQATDTRGY